MLIEFNYDCTRPNLQGQNDYAEEQGTNTAVAGFMDILCVVHKAASILTLMELRMN